MKNFVKAGILTGKKIRFSLTDNFIFTQKNSAMKGDFVAEFSNSGVLFENQLFTEIYFINKNSSVFELKDVIIGKDFHWQQAKNQRFEGDLKIISDGKNLIAINIIDIEKYLYSVISSEMSAMSFPELLKAHAVISRSWLLTNINSKTKRKESKCENQNNSQFIKWYERDSHTLFDVCADDHCQRYQGIQHETPALKQTVEETKGEVLTYGNDICDARFSKCCGGYSEQFSSCWENKNFDYLPAKYDYYKDYAVDLTQEKEAEKFILTSPKCFCNTNDKQIINQIFNDYDQNTQDFFRWQVKYSQSELSEIIKSRSCIDFGDIIDLIPIKRGQSGRIILLKIVGSKRTLTVGKELEIRKWLSKSHLYSSAFVVEKDKNCNFILIGAGWGHGVGLCQVGAAVMASKGYDYKQILSHYYPNSTINRIY